MNGQIKENGDLIKNAFIDNRSQIIDNRINYKNKKNIMFCKKIKIDEESLERLAMVFLIGVYIVTFFIR